jgi:chromate reductase
MGTRAGPVILPAGVFSRLGGEWALWCNEAIMKILVFAGSTRIGSWNRKLAHVVARMTAAAGAEVTHIELADFDVPMYNADLEARGTPADVMRLKQVTYEHAAWLICTPEYNASYPALLKNTLDWISSPVKADPVWKDDFRSSRGKVVGVLSASPGALGGLRSQSHLVPLLFNLHCWVCPKVYALSRAADAFDAQGELVADAAKKNVQAVIDEVLWAAARLAPDGAGESTA